MPKAPKNDLAPRYVLITPARNEASTIGRTIESVVNQSLLPRRWVIVSDNSEDATDDIVRKYQSQYKFIRLIHRDDHAGRDFGSKVRAIDEGYMHVKDLKHCFVGNLDADVSFGPQYFEMLIGRFLDNPKLGIAGGVTVDFYDEAPHERYASLDSVSGSVQMFRRECYEQIGGYRPLAYGSEDALALHMARWKGWDTRAFPELPVTHHRRTGTASHSIWRARFDQGLAQYAMGWSPLFVGLRAFYRTIESPYVFGSIVRTCGYAWAAMKREPRQGSNDLLRFVRTEQRQKLLAAVFGQWRPWRPV